MKKLGIREVGVLALAIASSSMGLSACSKQDGTSALEQRAVGGIGFKLSLPGGTSVTDVEYTISGPEAFSKTGKIPLGGSGNTFSAKIDGLPAGTGYTIKLSADEAGGSECMGSASFDVIANQTTAVSVKLQCPGKKSGGHTGDGNGSVVINGVINFCPVVQSATATPTGNGSTYNLVGLGTDEDSMPAPLSYKWTADGGATLSGTNAANVTLTCPSSGGTVSVVFEVLDGTPEQGGCSDKLVLASINCTPCTSNCNSSGGAGTAGTPVTGGAGTGGTGGETVTAGAGTGGTPVGGAGTGGSAGTPIGGAGTGGTAGTPVGGAGTGGTAGTPVGGAGTGGMSGGPGGGTFDPTACNTCETMDHDGNTNCTDSRSLCDTVLVAPKNAACKAALDCFHRTGCAKTAVTDCFCGAGRDPQECWSGTLASATGLCKAEAMAAAEVMESSTTAVMDMQARYFDTTYAIGAAGAVTETCDGFFCMTQCFP